MVLILPVCPRPNSDNDFSENPWSERLPALPHTDRTYFSSEERFTQIGPRSADVTTAQIWKSLHIVAATATAVLTREREISTCPHHIPALTLNNTRLLSELNPLSPPPQRLIRSGKMLCLWNPGDRWLQELHNPDQMWSSMRYSRNLKCLSWIIWHRSSKTWRTTKKLGEKEGAGCGGDWWPSRLSDRTALRGVEEEQYCHGATSGTHLTLIKSSQGESKENSWRSNICNYNLSVLQHCVYNATQQPCNL